MGRSRKGDLFRLMIAESGNTRQLALTRLRSEGLGKGRGNVFVVVGWPSRFISPPPVIGSRSLGA